jgi:hypothetical protein
MQKRGNPTIISKWKLQDNLILRAMKFLTISQETTINKAEEKETENPQTTKTEMPCESKQQFLMYHDHQQQHIWQ